MPFILFLESLLLVIFLIGCDQKVQKLPQDMEKDMVYIGTYTMNQDSGNSKSEGIYICTFDTSTGKLAIINSSASINPSYLSLSADRKYLYAVNETGSADTGGLVSAFRLTGKGQSMEFINKVPSMGDFPCFIETDKSGKFVIVANYGTGNIAVFPLSHDGSIGMAVFTDQHKGKGATSRQQNAHAHSSRVSPDNRFVYSCDLGTDGIYVYEINSEGKLKWIQTFNTPAGSGPRHIEFHPTLNYAYVINELNGTIQCLSRNTTTGILTGIQLISTVNNVLSDAGSADIHIAPSGEFLYSSNRGSLDNIAVYKIDTISGQLKYTESHSALGKTPRNFAIHPNGKWLLVANQNSDQVVTFRIDPKLGKLHDTGIAIHIPKPVCIKFAHNQ